MIKSISEIAELYVMSCKKHNTKPLQTVLDHLKTVDLNSNMRQPILSLKAVKLTPEDCEPLEEVFKRIQYKAVDVSSCSLNEAAVSALCQMIEYYEAANDLDISSNTDGLTQRGWTALNSVVSRSQELQMLNAEGNPISVSSAESLGNALNTSNMHTLKLEHCGLKGAPLNSFCCKVYHNKNLKELWLAYNDLDCTDAAHLADLLRVNHYIELIDISNNNIRDEGMMYLVQALVMQSSELQRRSNLQRTAAIEDDENVSPIEYSAPVELSHCSSSSNESLDEVKMPANTDEPLVIEAVRASGDANVKKTTELVEIVECAEKNELECGFDDENESDIAKSTTNKSTEPFVDNDADDDTEDTTVRASINVKNNNQTAGQSMLDKLLSMNSDSNSSSNNSSSEEGPSIISTDTLAACGSEDISVTSDEIFDATATGTITSTNIRNSMLAATTISTTLATMTLAANVITTNNGILSGDRDENSTTLVAQKTANLTTQALTLHEEQIRSIENVNNLCDNISLKEATNVVFKEHNLDSNEMISEAATSSPTVSSNSSSGISTSSSNSSNNSNNDNGNCLNNNNNNNCSNSSSISISNSDLNNSHQLATGTDANAIFEVTAEESDCINDAAATATVVTTTVGITIRPFDVNKNTRNAEDYEDTHSTDSAFESASEGDISRHLPDEFGRLSASLESTRLDDMTKDLAIETAIIATESTECLAIGDETVTTSTTPTTVAEVFTESKTTLVAGGIFEDNNEVFESCNKNSMLPKVTIIGECLTQEAAKEQSNSPIPSPIPTPPTPPPPSTSPGGISTGMRRTESTSAFLCQSARIHSQSSDSLCSENSLDGSTCTDHNFAEKLTKNDTLSRRHLVDTSSEATIKSQSGLKALTIWSNNLTKESGKCIAELLEKTISLELLNIGKNCLSNDFVTSIKDSLIRNQTLTTLGLQSAHLSALGIETLASILSFGGNNKLQRIDVRDNKLDVESLNVIAEVLRSNKRITQIDINDEPKRLTLPILPIVNVTPPTPLPEESVGSDAHLDYTRILENIRSMCSRNEKIQAQLQAEKSATMGGSSSNNSNKCRGGYYLGSRKISLTCHTRPLVDAATGTVSSSVAVSTTPTPAAKLEVKRKSGARLRSPGPSPPTISPSSSPNRSRFQVSRVHEVSLLTSPLAQIPPSQPPKLTSTSSCVSIPTATASVGGDSACYSNTLSLPTSNSLPAMASVTSSTQTIKNMSISPRSRFLVSRIYEDDIPLYNCKETPITPPLNPPPTPILKSTRITLGNKTSCVNVIEPEASTIETSAQQNSTNSETTTTIPSVAVASAAVANNKLGASSNVIISSSTSSTTSPCSLSSNSSLSPSSLFSATSSSSSTTTDAISVGDNSNGSRSSVEGRITIAADADLRKSCPIAVFSDNDITLTKESVASIALSSAVHDIESCTIAPSSVEGTTSSTTQNKPAQPQQRSRKMSWIANPTPVDKLLSLFNAGPIFQRNASPESKVAAQPTCELNTNNALGLQHPSNWTKHSSTEFLNASDSTCSSNINVRSSMSNTAAITFEQSRTFLDAASRQFRDFSKQVFRQNLPFGNDNSTAADAATAATTLDMSVVSGNSTTTINASNSNNSINSTNGEVQAACDTANLPANLKCSFKENISPEHAINEETLHNMQKLEHAEIVLTNAIVDLCDIEIVSHEKLSKCMEEENKQQDESGGTAALNKMAQNT